MVTHMKALLIALAALATTPALAVTPAAADLVLVSSGGLDDAGGGPLRVVFNQEPGREFGRLTRAQLAAVCVAALRPDAPPPMQQAAP